MRGPLGTKLGAVIGIVVLVPALLRAAEDGRGRSACGAGWSCEPLEVRSAITMVEAAMRFNSLMDR